MPHLPPRQNPVRRIPLPRSFPLRCHPCPIAVLGATSVHLWCRKREAVPPSRARKPRNRLALRPPDAATILHSVRNTSARIATRLQNGFLLPWFSSLLLEAPGSALRTWAVETHL